MNLYFIGNRKAKVLKIGVSQDTHARRAELQRNNPYDLEVFADIFCGETEFALDCEEKLHEALSSYRIRGEWFHLADGADYLLAVAQKGDLEAVLSTAERVGSFHTQTVFFCSFCSKTNHAAKLLIAGRSGFICDECVPIAVKALADFDRKQCGNSRATPQVNEA